MYIENSNNMFFDAYIVAALWSSTDNNDEPLDDNFCVDDIDIESLNKLKKIAVNFFTENIELINEAENYSYDQAGHDLWLTQNGHGAGFWDRDLNDIGDTLTTAAEKIGAIDLYVGDDGKLYI